MFVTHWYIPPLASSAEHIASHTCTSGALLPRTRGVVTLHTAGARVPGCGSHSLKCRHCGLPQAFLRVPVVAECARACHSAQTQRPASRHKSHCHGDGARHVTQQRTVLHRRGQENQRQVGCIEPLGCPSTSKIEPTWGCSTESAGNSKQNRGVMPTAATAVGVTARQRTKYSPPRKSGRVMAATLVAAP